MNPQEAKKLEKKIFEILSKYIKEEDALVIGFSGGPDSVFLGKMFFEFQSKVPIKLVFAHLNHSLRGQESEKDQKFCEKFAEKAIFELKKVDIKEKSKILKKGLEETGRHFRYDFFNKLAKKYKAKYIITAHHADDNLETVIMNFTRGASLNGLIGMKEKEENLLRPLLSIDKKEIIDYLKLKKVAYQTDKSNEDKKYTRNYVRHEIIPSLLKINPNLPKTISDNRENFKEIQKFINSEAEKWIEKNSLNKIKTKFDIKNFKKLEKALQKNIIFSIYKLQISNLQNIEKKHLDEVLELINKNIGNKKKKFGKICFYLNNEILEIQL